MKKLGIAVSFIAVACSSAPNPPRYPAPGTAVAAPGSGTSASAASGVLGTQAKATKIRTVEGITEYKLDNGLQVLLFPDPTQSTVTVNITYLVGSRLEGYGETGMAHLLEHLLFKGSPRYRNVLKLVEERGGQINGSTWTDRTNYYETLPASQENLDWALAMEADRMLNASVSAEDLKTEFSVVRNEFEMGENDPGSVLEQRVISAAYLWHNYGKDTIGSRSDIERVPIPALRAFYQKYYQPDNAVLIVSGKFEDDAALASVQKSFGVIPRPARKLSDSYSVEPVQDGERSVVLRRNGEVFRVVVAYHTVGAASPDYPAVQAALDILTREPSGRLYKKLVETKWAANVGGGQLMFRDPYLATISAEIRDGKRLEDVERAIFAQTEGLGLSTILPQEVERWRAATLKSLELAMADSQLIAVELSEFAALGDWRTLFAYRDRVSAITPDDVARVAKTFFKATNRTSGRFIPTQEVDRAPFTETPDVVAAVKGIEGGKSQEQGEKFAATLDNIDARTKREVLKSGLKAAFLPKKTRGGKVKLRLTLHFGDEKSLQGKTMTGPIAIAMLSRGTTKKSYQEIADLQDQLKAEISISGSANQLSLSIDTLRDKLPAALELAGEMLTSPSFPAKQLELIKQETLVSLEEQQKDPQTLAYSALNQLAEPWPKNDPRYSMSPAEQIVALKKVSLGEVRSFYRDFVGASHGELVVVGDFDPKEIREKAETILGGWKSKRPYTRIDSKVFAVAGVEKKIDIKDKEMTQLVLAHDVSIRDRDPDYPAWLMAGQILGGDSGSRIWTRLREKEGLSYGAGAWTYAGIFDDAGGLGLYAIVAPQNAAKAKAMLLEEIARISSATASESELKMAKESWIKQQDTSLSDDGFVSLLLSNQLYRERDMAWTKKLRQNIMAVTLADVERVAKKYIQSARIIIVDAGDQSKAGVTPKK